MRTIACVLLCSLALGCSSSNSSSDPNNAHPEACTQPASTCSITFTLVSGPSAQCGSGSDAGNTFTTNFSASPDTNVVDTTTGQTCTQTFNGCSVDRDCPSDGTNPDINISITFDGKGGAVGTGVVTLGSTTCKYTLAGTRC